jgi:hypothetical protein
MRCCHVTVASFHHAIERESCCSHHAIERKSCCSHHAIVTYRNNVTMYYIVLHNPMYLHCHRPLLNPCPIGMFVGLSVNVPRVWDPDFNELLIFFDWAIGMDADDDTDTPNGESVGISGVGVSTSSIISSCSGRAGSGSTVSFPTPDTPCSRQALKTASRSFVNSH